MKIPDLWSRAGKTFLQAFGGVLIPQIVLVLSNLYDYDWTKWYVWALPIIAGAIAAGISAGWNAIINATDKGEENGKDNT